MYKEFLEAVVPEETEGEREARVRSEVKGFLHAMSALCEPLSLDSLVKSLERSGPFFSSAYLDKVTGEFVDWYRKHRKSPAGPMRVSRVSHSRWNGVADMRLSRRDALRCDTRNGKR